MTQGEETVLTRLVGEIGEMRGRMDYFLGEVAPHLMTKEQCNERHGISPGRLQKLEAGKQREYGARMRLIGTLAGIGICMGLIGGLVVALVT